MARLMRATRRPRPSPTLHGSAPDTSAVALLLVDVINDFAFEEGREVLGAARAMATRIRQLKARAARAGIPVVYVNDNFGRWRSDFRKLVAHCSSPRARGRDVARRLRPGPRDYFILKPQHSGFYGTALDLLLQHLGARTLIVSGLLADSCVLITAQEAHMRGYHVVVPSDCVAARTPEDHARALVQLRRQGVDAHARPSSALDLDALLREAARRPRGA